MFKWMINLGASRAKEGLTPADHVQALRLLARQIHEIAAVGDMASRMTGTTSTMMD